MTNINFKCPYCNQPTTITDPNHFSHWKQIIIERSDKGDVGVLVYLITCPNPKCNKLFLRVKLTNAERSQSTNWSWGFTRVLHEWQLLPESDAKVLQDYIPIPIQEDYYEACRIRDLSPKASATLARRCLQGMIRDFWGIKKSTLKSEIDALEKLVHPLTWEAIDSVRKVGNIGAHMEKDIDIIIDVDPKEAQLLIELIEQLIDDWYVVRYEKEQRLSKIKELSKEKDKLKTVSRAKK